MSTRRVIGALLYLRATSLRNAVIARLAESGTPVRARSVRAADTYVPLGSATAAVLVGEDEIVAAAQDILR